MIEERTKTGTVQGPIVRPRSMNFNDVQRKFAPRDSAGGKSASKGPGVFGEVEIFDCSEFQNIGSKNYYEFFCLCRFSRKND